LHFRGVTAKFTGSSRKDTALVQCEVIQRSNSWNDLETGRYPVSDCYGELVAFEVISINALSGSVEGLASGGSATGGG